MSNIPLRAPGPQGLKVDHVGGGDNCPANNQVVSKIPTVGKVEPDTTPRYVNGDVSEAALNGNGASGLLDCGVSVLIGLPD